MLKKLSVLLIVLAISITGCSKLDELKEEGNPDNTNQSEKVEENKAEENKKLEVKNFIPKGNYKVKFNVVGDSYNEEGYIKGNGERFQMVTITGKGPRVDVYEAVDDYIAHIYSGDLTEEEAKDLSKVDYLDIEHNQSKVVLKSPIEKSNSWDGKEIVEVGKNIELNGKTIEGNYVKTWERKADESATTYVFLEGMGIIRISDKYGDVVSEISLESYEELK